MIKFRNSIAAVVLIALMISGIFAQQPRQSNDVFLQAKSRRFLNYSADFRSFLSTTKGDDRDFSLLLREVVSDVHERISMAQTLLNIYDNLSCTNDRESTWAIIKGKFDDFAQGIDGEILTVTGLLSEMKLPAMAASATELKEDLRELKDFFKAIRPKREGEK